MIIRLQCFSTRKPPKFRFGLGSAKIPGSVVSYFQPNYSLAGYGPADIYEDKGNFLSAIEGIEVMLVISYKIQLKSKS